MIDATNGNQPRFTYVAQNLIHEIGMYGKQVCGFFQSLACETTLEKNVMFNGPRAGINFNDGMGGGGLIQRNLIFNMVRETGDHGPFNSWDRQPYVTKVLNGSDSLIPKVNVLQYNFLINNYHSTWPIDNDDGSCFYLTQYNFLIYGGYKNYLGHSKTIMNNIYIYPDAKHLYSADENGEPQDFFSMPYCANSDGAETGISGWNEVWMNNTCVIGNPVVYEFGSCNPNNLNDPPNPFTANNMFYLPNQKISFVCDKTSWTLPQFQAKGRDLGSQLFDPPSTATIIQWGKQLLFQQQK